MAETDQMSTDAWGISGGYEDAHGVRRLTTSETRSAILAAMGVGEREPPPVDPVRVVRAGRAISIPTRAELTLEDGSTLRIDRVLPPDLPLGYHELRPETDGAPVRLIVCPGACFLPDGMRAWGIALQLYALRSTGSWGIGDAADLREFGRLIAELGGQFTLINPLGSGTPVAPVEPSPYFPSSRRYRDLLYVRIEEAPGTGALGHAVQALAAAGRALNANRRIDREAVLRLKLDALGRLFARFGGDPAYEHYCATQGSALTEFATFCTLAERYGRSWRRWPSEYRRSDTSAVRRVAESAGRVQFHRWVQWVLDVQLGAAARIGRIIQDLPIGFDPDGADAWAWQDHLAADVSVGAPPDRYTSAGQNWRFLPFVPHRLRATGYEPFVQTVRAVLRHAGGLRIDHVMGLFRLYWIPRGMTPANGAYVRYRADELLGILALESHRAGAVVVGEDLGTVEAGVRERLDNERILGCRVLWFEDTPPGTFPVRALATVTTHDLPTIAGLWSGSDVREQRAVGLAPNEKGLGEVRDRLRAWIEATTTTSIEQVVARTHRLLASAPSAMISATLEDILALESRPNMPGTNRSTRSNWSTALPMPLETLRTDPRVRACAETLKRRDLGEEG